MSFIDCELSGGFGNRLCKYAFARAYARRVGATLRTTPWQGQQIFEIDDPPMTVGALPKVNTYYFPDWDGVTDVAVEGDPQHQKHLIYSRTDARAWFKFRPNILELLEPVPPFPVAAHLRWGDFVRHDGFIPITKQSYEATCAAHGIAGPIRFVCEEDPIIVPGIEGGYRWKGRKSDDVPGLGFLPDFVALMRAEVLLRGPSTFGWWAAVLGDNRRVFSPDQRGIPHDGSFQRVPFVEGNHAPITAWWEGHSELHLPA